MAARNKDRRNPDPALKRLTKKARALLEELERIDVDARSMLYAGLTIDHKVSFPKRVLTDTEAAIRVLAECAERGIGQSLLSRRGRPSQNRELLMHVVAAVREYRAAHSGRFPPKTKDSEFEQMLREKLRAPEERHLHHAIAWAVDYDRWCDANPIKESSRDD